MRWSMFDFRQAQVNKKVSIQGMIVGERHKIMRICSAFDTLHKIT